MADAICGDLPEPCDAIVEIGPGRGALTRRLAAMGRPLHLFERDPAFLGLLGSIAGPGRVHAGDALGVDFEAFLRERGIARPWLVGNLPFNASVPLFLSFLASPSLGRLTLMFQREVARRIDGASGRKSDRGSLQALSRNYFRVEALATAPPEAFTPRPRVAGVVLGLARRADPPVPLGELPRFGRFLREAFSHRRKRLAKVLSARRPPGAVGRAFGELGIGPSARAEDLGPEEMRGLYRLLGPG